MTQQRLVLNQPKQQGVAVVPSPSSIGTAAPSSTNQPNSIGQIAQTWPLKCVVAASEVITIPAPVYFGTSSPLQRLANLLHIGRQYHPIHRGGFTFKNEIGFYAYERRTEWYTCAVSAAFAGAFGPSSVERADFSKSEAIFRLNRWIGYNLDELWVIGPTGRHATVYDEMILLTDANGWSRRGTAEWLPTAAIVQQGMVPR